MTELLPPTLLSWPSEVEKPKSFLCLHPRECCVLLNWSSMKLLDIIYWYVSIMTYCHWFTVYTSGSSYHKSFTSTCLPSNISTFPQLHQTATTTAPALRYDHHPNQHPKLCSFFHISNISNHTFFITKPYSSPCQTSKPLRESNCGLFAHFLVVINL